MAKRPDYIPRNMDAFNTWQINLLNTVTANAAAWNLLATAVADLVAASAAFAPIYQAVSNKENRTRQQMVTYNEFRTQYVAQLRSFVQSYLANNASIPMSDRVGMGLNPRGFTPREPKGPITTAPEVSLKALGGGKVRFSFKPEEDGARASMHPDSTGIAIYFRFAPIGVAPLPVPQPIPAPAPMPTPMPPPMPPAPTGGDSGSTGSGSQARNAEIAGLPTMTGYELEVSTRARFLRLVPMDRIGMVMHVFAQWINTSKPQNNGNYSTVKTVVIG